MVTDFVLSTIQYIEKTLQVEAIGAVVIIALILLAILAAILLMFRSARLWYWKINKQIDTLENIDKSLLEIKENLCYEAEKKEKILSESMEVVLNEEPENISEIHITESTETNEAELQTDIPKIVFDKEEENERQKRKPEYSVGKNGKVYVEELLWEQIQF